MTGPYLRKPFSDEQYFTDDEENEGPCPADLARDEWEREQEEAI